MNLGVSVKDFVLLQLVTCKGAPSLVEVVCSLSFGPLPTVPLWCIRNAFIDACFRRTLASFMTDDPLYNHLPPLILITRISSLFVLCIMMYFPLFLPVFPSLVHFVLPMFQTRCYRHSYIGSTTYLNSAQVG